MIVTNLTKGPLRIPLGKGKVLHLGPRKSAHVLQPATERPSVQRMVEREQISIRAETDDPKSEMGGRGVGDENGLQPARIQRKGLA